jgi:hypothetical protein
MERWIYITAFIIFCFALFVYHGEAAIAPSSVNIVFSDDALARGYTVKSVDDFFWLPIFPNQFGLKNLSDGQLTVELDKVENWPELPSGADRLSSVYFYKVGGVSADDRLSAPILLSLKYFSDSLAASPTVYFYGDNGWEALDTKILEKDRLARAWSFVASGFVAVVEKNESALTARSAIVIDDKTGDVLFAKNGDIKQSIASITKIITALVFLDKNPGWKKIIEIKEEDNVGGASLNVDAGDSLTIRDLFFATLVGSKNNAAMALARSTGLSAEDFVKAMNEKAADIGTDNTTFVEPTGLDCRNVSTAEDLAKIMRQAFRSLTMLQATTVKSYAVKILNKNKKVTVANTNKLLATDLYITGGKTGHTDEAGYCLGTKARVNGRDVLAVVLGAAPEKNYEEVYYLLKKFSS